MALVAACAATLLGVTGCSKEGEYEKCMKEKTKAMPEMIAKPIVEKAMESFRNMKPEEQKAALEQLKAELKK